MNAVNFSDGVDGLAAGVCAIAGDRVRVHRARHRRPQRGHRASRRRSRRAPPRSASWSGTSTRRATFMGDSGSNLLGLLLGSVAVLGSVKTSALVGLIAPLAILAVPFLDTTFVVLKRMKYRAPDPRRRRQPLPPPLQPHRLQPAPDRRSTSTRGPPASPARRSRCASSLLRPPRPPQHRLDDRHGRLIIARPGRERLPRLPARDPQVPPLRARSRTRPHRRRGRRGGPALAGDRRVRGALGA